MTKRLVRTDKKVVPLPKPLLKAGDFVLLKEATVEFSTGGRIRTLNRTTPARINRLSPSGANVLLGQPVMGWVGIDDVEKVDRTPRKTTEVQPSIVPKKTPVNRSELTVLLPVTRTWSMSRVVRSIAESDIPRGTVVLILDAPGCEGWISELKAIGFKVEAHRTGNPEPPEGRMARRKRHLEMRRLSQTLVGDGPLLLLEDDTLIPRDVMARLSATKGSVSGIQIGRHPDGMVAGVVGAKSRKNVVSVDACGHYCLLTTGAAYKQAQFLNTNKPLDQAHTAQIRPLHVDWNVSCGHLLEDGSVIVPDSSAREGYRIETEEAAQPQEDGIDFVILNYKSTVDTGKLLMQLGLDMKDHPYTVTVIDNTLENRGFAKGCNLGACVGTAPTICFLNPDISLVPGWADETLAAMRADPSLVIAGPRLDDGLAWPRDLAKSGIENWVCGAAFFVRRDFFESVDGFDERYFFTYEETDLIRQAEKAGYRVETIGEPRIRHIRHNTPFHDEQLAIARAQYLEKWGAK